MAPPKQPPLPMMPWFVRDHISSTRHMSLAERGAYFDLMSFEWDSDAPLPEDPDALARLLGCERKEFKAVWPVVSKKFVARDGGLVNERLERVRLESREKHRKSKEKAAAAAAARWERERQRLLGFVEGDAPSNAPSMPEALLEQCHPSPSPSPSIKHSEERPSRTRARPAIPTGPRARPDTTGNIVESEEVQRRRREAADLIIQAKSA